MCVRSRQLAIGSDIQILTSSVFCISICTFVPVKQVKQAIFLQPCSRSDWDLSFLEDELLERDRRTSDLKFGTLHVNDVKLLNYYCHGRRQACSSLTQERNATDLLRCGTEVSCRSKIMPLQLPPVYIMPPRVRTNTIDGVVN